MSAELAQEVLTGRAVADLVAEHPYLENFFAAVRLDPSEHRRTVIDILNDHPEEYFSDYGLSKARFAATIVDFVARASALDAEPELAVRELTVLPGRNKLGVAEPCALKITAGQVTTIVGPTGAGKSRLLEDIESLAQGDTPTGRSVLIDGHEPSDDQRYQLGHRLVAQLTQNMNFVIDLPAADFIAMHARSRQVGEPEQVAAEVIACANELSGEPFAADTALTQLSGGQSRALMIADVALVSTSPIILIDEIENAGIDRRRALELLIAADKIVLMSTHDPILALLGDQRVVVHAGGITDVIATTDAERANLGFLSVLDGYLNSLRQRIRAGERFDEDLSTTFSLSDALGSADSGSPWGSS